MAPQITSGAQGFLWTGSIYAMSNGAMVALVRHSNAGYYSVSTDGGTTWGPLQALATWSSLPWFMGATQNGNTLTLLTSPSFSTLLAQGAPSGSTLSLVTYTFNTSTNQFGTPATTALAMPVNYAGSTVQFGDILWNSGDSKYYVAFSVVFSTGHKDIQVLRCTAGGVVDAPVGNGWNFGTFYGFSSMAISGSTLAVLAGDDTRTTAVLFPVSISGALSMELPEPVAAIAFDDAPQTVLQPDGSGHVDLVTLNQHTGEVFTVRRTAAATYTVKTTLDTVGAFPYPPAAVFDPTSTDLTVFYGHADTQTAGHLYAIRRQAGVWQARAQVDTTFVPTANPTASSVHGVMAMGTVYSPVLNVSQPVTYVGAPAASAPNAPTNLSPNGPIGTVTPALSWTSVNPAVGDPHGAYEVTVTRDSDGTVMWDTGTVVSSTTGTTYAGTALSFNEKYTWSVRDKDTLSASGAGTWSPWSSAPLQPVHLPSATITSVAFAGTTAGATPFTLTDPTLAPAVTYAEADGHACDLLQAIVYASDGVTVQETGPSAPQSPTIANGASAVLPAHLFSTLANHTTYTLGVLSRDAVTGRVNVGPLWTFTTTWPPPQPVTGLIVTPNPDTGRFEVAWTNSVSAFDTLTLSMKRSDSSTWIQQQSGPCLVPGLELLPCPTIPYDVQIVVSNGGQVSTPAVYPSVVLTPRCGMNGVWLTDSLDPDRLNVAFGPTDNFASLRWTAKSIVETIMPAGGRWPRDFPSLLQYNVADTPVQFTVYDTEGTLSDGTLARGQDTLDALRQMAPPRMVAGFWRTPRGEERWVKVTAYYDEPVEEEAWTVYLTLEERQPPATPLVILNPRYLTG